MKMIGIGHMGINAGDISASLHFYGTVLGFTVENTVNWPEFSLTNVRIPDGRVLELFDYGNRPSFMGRDNSAVGYRHLAFLVDDVDQWYTHLISHNVPVTMTPSDIPDLGTRAILCRDPNGVEVELYQTL